MEKKYLSHLYNMDAEASDLLGFFDSEKNYIIEDNIIQELIKCKKLINESTREEIKAVATFPDFKINFTIYLQDGEGNKKRAGLFVNETCKLEIDNKTLTTYVDSFIGDNSPVFFEDLKRKYFLFSTDESEGIDLTNSEFVNIIKKKTSSKKYKTMIPLLYDADMDYVKRMLALLKTSGAYSNQFLKTLKNAMEEKKVNRASPNYWRDVRILLDKLLIKNTGLFNQTVQDKINKLQQEYLDVFSKTKIEEKKPASKSKSKGSSPKKWDGPPKPPKAKGAEKKGGGKKNNAKSKENKQENSKDTKTQEKPQPNNKTIKKQSNIEIKETIKIVGKDGKKYIFQKSVNIMGYNRTINKDRSVNKKLGGISKESNKAHDFEMVR